MNRILLLVLLLLLVPAQFSHAQAAPPELTSLCWIAYAPTNYNPEQGVYPSEESIRLDLEVLRAAGFNGLVTYGSQNVLGSVVPRVAQEAGFEGMIMGIWDPASEEERANALAAANYDVILGYVIGNEGLDVRYSLDTLRTAIGEVRAATGRSVTTTEEWGDYRVNSDLLQIGDWVYPNVHPFYAGILDPARAVDWTLSVYDEFEQLTNLPIVFKEVGLPTDGDPNDQLSEMGQAEYYRFLQETDVNFTYFEAFDQPWKQFTSVEPYWGIYRSDRTPKEAVQYVCQHTRQTTAVIESTAVSTPDATPIVPEGFAIYTDADSRQNHFVPSGYMGDVSDLTLNEAWTDNPYVGRYAIRVAYTPLGQGPNTCAYQPPCRWGGIYWLQPADNWGIVPDAGFDLSQYSRLSFWARSDNEVRVEFGVGGVTGEYPDSLQPSRSTGLLTLTSEWIQYEIDLSGADLTYIIGGFYFVLNWRNNGIAESSSTPLVFYLDNIIFQE
jgi:exo-beta-1,3-glucanase (GH17 family)